MSTQRSMIAQAISLSVLIYASLIVGCDSEGDPMPTPGITGGNNNGGGVMMNGGNTPPGGGNTPPGGGNTPPGGGNTPPGGGNTPPGGGNTPPGGGNTPPGGGMMGGGFVPPTNDAGRCFQACLNLFTCETHPAETCGSASEAALAASCQMKCEGEDAGAITTAAMQGCAGGSAIVNAAGLLCIDESLCEGVTCEPGQGCEGGVCSPWACQPDFYDDAGNDNQENAYTLDFAPLASPGLTLCAGEEDWFRIEIPANGSVRFDLGFKDDEADIDMKLYEEGSDTEFLRSTSGNDNERITVMPSSSNRTVLLKVYVYSSAGSDDLPPPGRYGLYISTNLPAEICQSGIEDCGGDICNDAGVCVQPPPCMSDEDCYGRTCNLDTGECIECLVTEDCYSGVCDPSSNQCVGCLDNSTCVEAGEVCDVGGRQICVECLDNSQCVDGVCTNNYCVPNACNDMYEPNDEQMSAVPLGTGVSGAYICGDHDWYSLNLDGQPALLQVLFSHANGDIDAEILDSAGTQVLRRSSTSDHENFGLVGLSGPHFLHVYGFGGSGSFVNTYDVTLNNNPPGQVCGVDENCPLSSCDENNAVCFPEGYCTLARECQNRDPNTYCDTQVNQCLPCPVDAAEPNNTLEGAVSIERALGQELNVCGSRDFYAFNATEGKVIRINVLFSHANGDVDIKLYGPNETGEPTILESSVGVVDNESIEHTVGVGAAGTYYLEVYGLGTSNANTYQIELTL